MPKVVLHSEEKARVTKLDYLWTDNGSVRECKNREGWRICCGGAKSRWLLLPPLLVDATHWRLSLLVSAKTGLSTPQPLAVDGAAHNEMAGKRGKWGE